MSKYEKLKELKDLFDNGLINENEYSRLKNDILFPKNNHGKIDKLVECEPHKTESQLYNDVSNGLNSRVHIKEQSNKLSTRSNNNSSEDHSSKFLIITLIIVGIIFGFISIIKSNNDSNSSIVQDTLSTGNIDKVVDITSENITTTCKVCGRNFSGYGYDKIDDVWQRNTTMQTELCSQNCAMIEDQRIEEKYNKILEENGYKPMHNNQTSNSQKCSRCMGRYVDGFCDLCGLASPERVNESLSNRQNCEGCNGTGIMSGYDGNRICSGCNGTGKLTY